MEPLSFSSSVTRLLIHYQVGNDLQNSELEESEPDQAVRGGWDLEQYRIKQTIKGNFGAISGPLACTRYGHRRSWISS